jgi:adenylate kinase family enzyme
MEKMCAILLIGPTGSGKTPLGDLMEKTGAFGKRCFHFDFGANLRNIGGSETLISHFSQEEIAVIRNSLDTGALLENENFPIAAKILNLFIETRHININDLIILNGIPRHSGQADDADALVEIQRIIFLECEPHVILERIRHNTGGDRSGRADDSPEAIGNKLKIFNNRTRPLLDHYRSKGVHVDQIKVEKHTDPDIILRELKGIQI